MGMGFSAVRTSALVAALQLPQVLHPPDPDTVA